RHTRSKRDWSSDVCSSDLPAACFPQNAACQRLYLLRVHLVPFCQLQFPFGKLQRLPKLLVFFYERINRSSVVQGFSERCALMTPDRKSTRLNSSHVSISYA